MQLNDQDLTWLMGFYESLCNGDWEHSFGCSITNSDNPGWIFEFQLNETVFEDLSFSPYIEIRTERNWINCQFAGGVFKGVGGPRNLSEIIAVFQKWIESTGL